MLPHGMTEGKRALAGDDGGVLQLPMMEGKNGLKHRLAVIIFGTNTRAGRLFDAALIVMIAASVIAVMLESVAGIENTHGTLLRGLEWAFTIAFTVEYLLRLAVVQKKSAYAFSFFGIIDFLSIIPTYLAIFLTGSQFFIIVRVMRLLRIFRVFKLARYLDQADMLVTALKASSTKIFVFLFAVMNLVIVIGTLMYLIEGEPSGFTSIPKGVYWAVVTLTTVGFGDITPQTPLGQFFASLVMVIGYGIIAVPTGIVTVELGKAGSALPDRKECAGCGKTRHETAAKYCSRCGRSLA